MTTILTEGSNSTRRLQDLDESIGARIEIEGSLTTNSEETIGLFELILATGQIDEKTCWTWVGNSQEDSEDLDRISTEREDIEGWKPRFDQELFFRPQRL